jgi:hypothetical protein
MMIKVNLTILEILFCNIKIKVFYYDTDFFVFIYQYVYKFGNDPKPETRKKKLLRWLNIRKRLVQEEDEILRIKNLVMKHVF